MNEKIVSTLVGLAGACQNNGKTDNTDSIVMKALLCCFTDEVEDQVISEIINDKFAISPNCKTCPTPCGNTSDYNMDNYHKNTELKILKEELLKETVALAARISALKKTVLPEEIYRAISYFGYELAEDSYINLIETIKQMEV